MKDILALLLLTLTTSFLTGCSPSRLEIDSEQGRLDQAAPLIAPDTPIGQTFMSHYPRLTAIEVLLVVYGDATPAGTLTFHLRTDPTTDTDLVTQPINTADLRHNQPLRIEFAPLPDSQNRRYYFFFDTTTDNQITVWYNTIDAYGQGTAFFRHQVQVGDLHFKTFYDYDLGMIVGDLLHGTIRYGWLFLPLLGFLWLPGYLIMLLTIPADDWPEPMLQAGLATGLSMAVLPLVLLFLSLVGISLTPRIFKGGMILLILATLWRLQRRQWKPLAGWFSRENRLFTGLFVSLFLLILALRMFQIRHLVVPAWVDSVHHTMIAQLIAAQGRVPEDYQPYMDIGPFIYHFGFHTLPASLTWLTGLPIQQSVLIVGQVVNALASVTAAGFAMALLHSSPLQRLSGPMKIAGLVTMGSIGCISLMPSYFVTWGRYTQLTGLVLLPVSALLTLWWVEKGQRWALLCAGIAIAGLGVTHYRVLVFYVLLAGAFLLYLSLFSPGPTNVLLARRKALQSPSPNVPSPISEAPSNPHGTLYPLYLPYARILALAGLAGLLFAPWLFHLLSTLSNTGQAGNWLHGQAAFNTVPRGLIDVGYDRVLLRLGLLSLLLGFLWWPRASITITLWSAGAILAANPNLLGLQETWLLSNASLVISLFLPVAVLTGILCAMLAENLLRILPTTAAWVMPALSLVLLLGFCILLLAGAWNLLDVVNPVTVIVTADDIIAMNWIREHTNLGDGFVTNVRIWQFDTYMGADGGYWIPLLTGRRTLVPPVIYSFGTPTYYYQVQETLTRLASVSDAQDPTLLELMQQHNLKYVYLGAKGGPLNLRSFLEAPQFEVAYSNGPVWIFRIVGKTTKRESN